MGTEVLRPQDCLVERLRLTPAGFHGRKNYFTNGFARANRKPGQARPDSKKKFHNQHSHHHNHNHNHNQELANSRRWSSADSVVNSHNRNGNGAGNGPRPVAGQVTILRRGQSLDYLNTIIKREDEGLVPNGRERLGPEKPEMLPKQIRLGRPSDVYAGSAFSSSPSPSSLPLPSFFKKQELNASFDDSATRDLRRLLRLEGSN